MLPAEDADDLTLFAFLCALDVSFRDGLETVPELD
jgi:hypothetical protein